MTAQRPALINAGDDGWLIWHPYLETNWYRFTRDDDPTKLRDQNGQPLRPGHQRGWFIAETKPTSICWDNPRVERSGPWKLINQRLAEVDPVRWPTEIGADVWDYDVNSTDDYRRETRWWVEEQTLDLVDAHLVDSTSRAVPPVDYDGVWQPWTIPSVLNGPELAPWLPGRLTGFRGHLAARLAELPTVSDVHCKSMPGKHSDFEPAKGPSFSVRRRWNPPRTRMAHPNGNKRRKKQQTETWVTVVVSLSEVPLSIEGVDLFGAVAKWDRAMNDWLAWFEETCGSDVRACGACDGQGWTP